jgi:hypothetical protein
MGALFLFGGVYSIVAAIKNRKEIEDSSITIRQFHGGIWALIVSLICFLRC